MLDVQWLVFRAVVECKGFSRAASSLHMTQSAVSQQIKALENYYGVALLERSGKHVGMTAAGQQLYPHVLGLKKLYQQARESVQAVREDTGHDLAVGASLTVGEYVLPERLAAFRRQHPLIRFELQVADPSVLYARVRAGRLAMALVESAAPPLTGVAAQPCGGDEVWIVASPKMPLPGLVVSLANLLSFPWVLQAKAEGTRGALEEAFIAHGLDCRLMNVVMALDGVEAIKGVVRQGGVIAALSSRSVARAVAAGDLMHIKLQEGVIKREYSLLLNQARQNEVAGETFRQFLQNSFVQQEKC